MQRSQTAYLYLAGIFIAALVACNLVVYKFFSWTVPDWVPLLAGAVFDGLSVGILPYPLTFLVTDLVSEIYGRRAANRLVYVGFVASLLVVGIVELGGSTRAMRRPGWYGPVVDPPSTEAPLRWDAPIDVRLDGGHASAETCLFPPDVDRTYTDASSLVGDIQAALASALPEAPPPIALSWSEVWRGDLDGRSGEGRLRVDDHSGSRASTLRLGVSGELERLIPGPLERRMLPASPVTDALFLHVFGGTLRAIVASMLAYLVAQWLDIQVYHFWRKLTKGRLLWLRNNGSTIFSQLIDTSLVVTVLFWGTSNHTAIPAMIFAGWKFKVLVALLDTPFLYAGVWCFRTFGLCPRAPTKEAELAQP